MFYVYILASARNGTLYKGITHDLAKRLWEHESEGGSQFAAKYGVRTLVWYESQESRQAAFLRERRIKTWNRAWKIELIEKTNPGWRDLRGELV